MEGQRSVAARPRDAGQAESADAELTPIAITVVTQLPIHLSSSGSWKSEPDPDVSGLSGSLSVRYCWHVLEATSPSCVQGVSLCAVLRGGQAMKKALLEYELPVEALFNRAVQAMIPAHEPLLAEIRSVPVDHIAQRSVDETQGYVSGGTTMDARVSVSLEAVTEAKVEVWTELVFNAAEQLASHQMRHLLSSMSTVTDRTGKKINVGGPMSHDAVLDMIEKTDFRVDDDGCIDGLAMIVHPSVADQISRLDPATPEQEERLRSIIAERKRVQDAAKRVRRLGRGSE